MFGTIRKHQTWLWAIIIVVVVISFVIYFNPSSQFSGGADVRPGDFGKIGGEKITLEKFAAAQREVELMYFSRFQNWPDREAQDSGFDVASQAFQRLLLLRKAKELGLRIKGSVVAQAAVNLLGNTSLATFEKQILNPRGLTAADFERFVRNEVLIQELAALVGASGNIVTPEEARAVYARENEELSAQIVSFLAADQLAQVTVSPEAVAQFYTNQMSRYRLPERVQVSYVQFSLSNHLAAAEAELVKTNLAEIIEANFNRLGTNYFPEAKTPEEIKAKIRENLIRQQAFFLAGKEARDFANALAAQEPVVIENLLALAREKGLSVNQTEPFDRETGPQELSVGPNFVQAAFKLNSDEPFTRPVPGNDAVYVLGFHKRLPSEIPPLESVRAQVAADCRYEQAVMRARQAGMSFVATLTNGLAQGKNFSELCTAAKLKPVLLPAVSLSTRSLPEVEQDLSLQHFKQIAFNTPLGQASSFVPTRDGGVIVYVKSRLPLDETKMKAELPEFTSYLRRVRQNETFNEWFRKQADEGLRNTAYAEIMAARSKQGATSRK